LDAQREAFFVDVDGIKLEAELFIPNGGAEQKTAVVFAPGSGDSLYQNYSPGFIETYILDVFLSGDIAVLLVNKRGMGLSEGLYTDLSIEGRAEDLLVSARTIQTHPKIDAEKIGLVGHSEGGWVVTYAAAQNPEIAFFINLAGPTIIRKEQAGDMYTFEAICSGLEGDDVDKYVEKRLKTTELGMKIGNDILVIPDKNVERMNETFDGNVPDNLTMAVAKDATHSFRLVDGSCDSWNDPKQYETSTEVIAILNDWLVKQGY
jgi:alpha/beta superfamily hydrolase